jgi:crotonobetainyl-CoA:carnitine CoA-transferase CaiB-like acyl-CoA transferase
MLPYTDAHWAALFEAVGEERLLEQPWFADHRSRLVHADEVYGLLASIITRKTTAEWVELATALGIPVSPVPPLAEIVDDAANHRGVLQDAEHPVVGTFRSIAAPLVFSASGQRPFEPAPLVAEHTAEILAELGYDDATVAELTAAGAVRGRPPS